MVIDLDLYTVSVDTGGIKDLSPSSVALCILAVGRLDAFYLWQKENASLNKTDWDVLEKEISLCLDELMSSMVGLIVPAVFSTASIVNFLPCDGSLYFRDDYPALYDVLDAVYIVSGTQFRTPDLTDRFPVGAGGSYSVDEIGGSDTVALSVAELPAHSHSYNQPSFGIDVESVGVPDPTGVGNPPIQLNTGQVGGGNAHENRPPFLALPFYIVAQ